MEAKKRIRLTSRLVLVVGIDLAKPTFFIEVERLNYRDERGLFTSPEHYREQMEKSLIV